MLNLHEKVIINNYLSYSKTSSFYLDKSNYVPLVSLFNKNDNLRNDNLSFSEHIFNTENVRFSSSETHNRIISKNILLLNENQSKIHFYSGNRCSAEVYENLVYSSLFLQKAYKNRSRIYENLYFGIGTMIKENENKVYCMLMVKKGYERYVKLCYLLNEPILEDCLEFWIDIEPFPTIQIQKRVNGLIKYFKSVDIPIVFKTDILSEIKASINIKANTFKELNEKVTSLVQEFQEFEIKRLNLVKT